MEVQRPDSQQNVSKELSSKSMYMWKQMTRRSTTHNHINKPIITKLGLLYGMKEEKK